LLKPPQACGLVSVSSRRINNDQPIGVGLLVRKLKGEIKVGRENEQWLLCPEPARPWSYAFVRSQVAHWNHGL
jgi:hypothetical protein